MSKCIFIQFHMSKCIAYPCACSFSVSCIKSSNTIMRIHSVQPVQVPRTFSCLVSPIVSHNHAYSFSVPHPKRLFIQCLMSKCLFIQCLMSKCLFSECLTSQAPIQSVSHVQVPVRSVSHIPSAYSFGVSCPSACSVSVSHPKRLFIQCLT